MIIFVSIKQKMYRYFPTKKQAEHEAKQKELEKKRKREYDKADRAWWADFLKKKEKRETEELNGVYDMVRYFVVADGTVKNYVKNYSNPYTRWDRLMFLNEDTIHDSKTQKHINETLSRRVK